MYVHKNSKCRVRIGKNLLLWGFVLVAMGAVTAADVGEAAAVEGTDEAVASAGGNEGAAAAVQTIAFQKDMRIQDALAVLRERYHRNIVPSPNIDGVLSFTRLFDVTFDEAMDAILGANFKYEQKGQLIKVYTKEEYKKMKADTDRMVHKVFTLYYITADEAAKLLGPVLSGAGKIQFSSPAETGISAASGGASGSTTGSLGSAGGGNSPALQDTIVVHDFPENIADAEKVLASLDKRPKQVLVEATILSAILTEGMELGVDWNFMAGAALTGVGGSAAVQDTVSGGALESGVAAQNPLEQIASLAGAPIESAGFADVASGGLRVGVSSGDFRAIFTALETVTDATVLANPKVLAVNKQEGSVLIGTNLGYRSSTTISAGGVATEGEVEFLQTGTQLVFRPYIGNDGYIRMDIYPKDSSATLNEDGVPTENTTQLKTNIVVKDGETIVIGGLFRDVVTTTRKQIPLLGDIPIIGALFRNTTDTVQREEVIILLTPHIIEEAGDTDGEARAADIGRKRMGAHDAVQNVSRAKMAQDHYNSAVQYYTAGNGVEALTELDAALLLRPTYLEAWRLKERIITEVSPAEAERMERIIVEVVEEQEAPMWRKR